MSHVLWHVSRSLVLLSEWKTHVDDASVALCQRVSLLPSNDQSRLNVACVLRSPGRDEAPRAICAQRPCAEQQCTGLGRGLNSYIEFRAHMPLAEHLPYRANTYPNNNKFNAPCPSIQSTHTAHSTQHTAHSTQHTARTTKDGIAHSYPSALPLRMQL